jgi:hypothetical protein
VVITPTYAFCFGIHIHKRERIPENAAPKNSKWVAERCTETFKKKSGGKINVKKNTGVVNHPLPTSGVKV